MDIIRAHLFIPRVERFRAPLYARVAADPGVELTIHVNRERGDRPSEDPTHGHDFAVRLYPPIVRLPLPVELYWHRGTTLPHDLSSGDVLILCGNARYLSLGPWIWQARRRGAAVMWWGLGVMPYQRRWALALRRKFMSVCDCLLLYSDREVEQYVSLGYPADRVFGTNNCIDQLPIAAAAEGWPHEALAAFRKREKLNGRHVLLYCGRLRSKARLHVVLEALAHLKDAPEDYLLVCIGAGPEEQRLKARAQALGVTECVRWLGPIFDEHRLAPWFLSATCLTYPGAIGLTLHHAFGYGLPVVTTGDLTKQSAEIYALRDGVNGLLFADDDASDLAATVRALALDVQLRTSLSREAHKTVTEEYTIDKMAERFLKALRTANAIAGASSR